MFLSVLVLRPPDNVETLTSFRILFSLFSSVDWFILEAWTPLTETRFGVVVAANATKSKVAAATFLLYIVLFDRMGLLDNTL